MNIKFYQSIPGLIGAAIGGVLGYYAYAWGYNQNLRAGVLPGAFIGLGCGLLSAHKSRARAAICGLAALGLGLYTDWHYFPFVADDGFVYFLSHIYEKPPLVLIMIALGTFLGFRWGGDAFKPGSPARPKPTPADPG